MDTKEPLESQQVADSTPSAGPAGPSRREFLGQSGRVAAGVGVAALLGNLGSMPCPTRPAGPRLRSAFCIR